MDSDSPAPADVGLVDSKPVFQGPRLKISLDRVRFPDGSEGELEMIRHPGASAILPVFGDLTDPDPDVLLIRQYRYATDGDIWEVPAGIPDFPEEPWDAVAHRELEEETGFKGRHLTPLTHIYTTPGFTDEVIHLYVATGLERGESNLDDDEFVEVVRLPFSEVLEKVRSREIVDCKSLATILYAAQFVIGKGRGA